MNMFNDAEIAFVVRCAGRGLTARQATEELNAKFGSTRIRESVIQIARRCGAPFGHTKIHPPTQHHPGSPGSALCAKANLEAMRSYRTSSLFVQPPILSGNAAADFERRDDEPEPRGRCGEFGKGCRWINGDPRSEAWRQCGHKRVAGSSYCLHHRERTICPRTMVSETLENKEGTK